MQDEESLLSAVFDMAASPGAENSFSFNDNTVHEPAGDWHDGE